MGKVNMLTTSGPLWRKWRSAFNPGFSVQHLVGQVPMIIDCCKDFVRILDEHSSADRVFRMEEEVHQKTHELNVTTDALLGDQNHHRRDRQGRVWSRLSMSY